MNKNLVFKKGFVLLTAATFLVGGFFVTNTVLAASTPTLGTAGTYGILSSTFTRNIGLTAVAGDLGYISLGGNGTHTASGAIVITPSAQVGLDQGTALSALALEACTFNFADGAINLATDTTHGAIGVYTPGVYCTHTGGAASIGTAGITLQGAGTYIFRINGALTSVDNSHITLDGANASDVFWTPTGATTLGANATFKGTVIDDANITVGANTAWIGRALAFAGTVTTVTNTIGMPATSGPVWEEEGTPNGILDSGEHFFQTIQSAINAGTTVSGDTIYVSAGTYYEQVIIDKAVSVLGAGATTTFIDGTGVTPVLPGLVNITNETGAVTLDGFTIRNAPAKGVTRIAIWAKQAEEGPVYSSSMTITHNILVGNYLVSTNDYGLYSKYNKSNLVFSYNDVSNFGGNALLFELHTGPAEISHNNITVVPDGSTAIFSMSFKDGYNNNNDVTGKQWLHHNIINANGGSAIVMASAWGYLAYNEHTNGTYSNVEITDNVITNVGDAKKGIQLEVDGDNGGFVNPLITGNTISAKELSPGPGLSRGIRIMGVVTSAQILDNDITGFYRGIYQSDSFSHLVYPTNTQISTNVITGGTYGIDIAGGTATIHLNSIVGNTLFGVNNQTVAAIDATNNWWGNASGPGVVGTGTGDKVSTNVTFDPWCVNETCTTPPPPPTPPRNSGRPAIPAIPATPAVPGVSPAIPATPAVPTGKVLGAASFNFTKFLKNNSKGDEVMEMQKFLNTLGHNCGTADGKFGPKTKACVIKFQLANKLKGDGIIGALTRVFLNK